ncbi:hypothetical protein [Rubricoccus marinus]|uniref:Outer membrane protein beta-barrel domain-containing protein n=1 Tax=Rubricoccus marinus TaxID=716817 RepID=A0A259TZR3_9BACT|nr:hypothetical protein [Rubricoccus marinus]OZC03242.1 hypothetical protein BSZ36_09800 [Rubricoccus marinus]
MRTPLLLAFLFLLGALPASAQIQGIGYRLTPSANYVLFDDDAALSDGLLYGGGVGFSFGEFIELGGSVQFGSFETDFEGLSGFDAPAVTFAGLAPRDVDVQRYGGALKLNLLSTAVVPYLTAGTGIVRLNPEGLNATRSIYLIGGAGVQFTAFDRFALSIAAEDFAYRYNPGATFFTPEDLTASGVSLGDFEQTTVHNLGVRAALNLYLGGRRPGELTDLDREFQRQFSGGLSGLSLVVEPFAAHAQFDDALSLRDQTFIGAEAGFDFGPLVGVRGFYARGTGDTNPTDIENVQMIGGNLRLRLSEGRGLVPFLSVGGGYLDVLDGYTTDESAEVENVNAQDSPFASAGLGIGFLVSPRLRAIGEVRGLLMSTQDEADLSQPEDVYFSPMYRVGLAVGLGGKAGRRTEVVRQSELDDERAMMMTERMQLEAARDSLRAEILSLEARRNVEVAASAAEREALRQQIADARASGDASRIAQLERKMAEMQRDTTVVERQTINGETSVVDFVVEEEDVIIEREVEAEHMVTIPLPREGELYVRYGPPGGVTIESSEALAPSEADLRAAVREALAEVLASRDPLAPVLTETELAEIENRLVTRVAARTAQRMTPEASGAVTMADLEEMEQRLQARFLDALRQALDERDN